MLKKLIQLHPILFFIAVLFTFLAALLNLCWNGVLAEMLDILGSSSSFHLGRESSPLLRMLILGIVIILSLALSEYVSSYLASYTCELWAHDMRMGYARYYLQSDIKVLSKLNAGEEQSAMQNELRDISYYLNANLFSFMKQFGSFAVTVVFLLCQSYKLALLSILPVIPLIFYCFISGKVIKSYTEQCQKYKGQINGFTDTILELFPIIKVYNAYKLMNSALDAALSEWEGSNIKKERVTAKLMSLSGVLSFVPLLLILGFGASMVLKGEISIGIFYIFINLSGNVSGFLQNMPNIYAGFRGFVASVGRLEGKLVLQKS